MTFAGFRLDGQVALVTGAARGLGYAMAEALAACGAYVLVNGRDGDAALAACEAIQQAGGQASPLVFDIADEDARAAAFARIDVEARPA
ncbi:MAG: SDR family NAD(P)-dependent oxidoreductase [Dehalococcoidia bacterium]|nr:SDR family NAD(P)-dependent oxidoreductase [Dehalococcoidia bacterium]